jgi:hypothetical protein
LADINSVSVERGEQNLGNEGVGLVDWWGGGGGGGAFGKFNASVFPVSARSSPSRPAVDSRPTWTKVIWPPAGGSQISFIIPILFHGLGQQVAVQLETHTMSHIFQETVFDGEGHSGEGVVGCVWGEVAGEGGGVEEPVLASASKVQWRVTARFCEDRRRRQPAQWRVREASRHAPLNPGPFASHGDKQWSG